MKSKKRKIEIVDCIIPEFYTCYLAYGDQTGLTEEEIAAIDNFFCHEFGGTNGHWSFPNQDAKFYKYHDLINYGILASDCVVMQWVIIP